MFTFRGMYFYKVNLGLKGGISIDADSGPLGYVLWCCGSRSKDFFTFIQKITIMQCEKKTSFLFWNRLDKKISQNVRKEWALSTCHVLHIESVRVGHTEAEP